MNKKLTKKCIICRRNFVCNSEGKGSRKNRKLIRRKDCLTCSHNCSIIYLRKKKNKNFNKYKKLGYHIK